MPEVQEAARAVSPQIVLCRLSAVVSEPRAAVFEFRQIALGDSFPHYVHGGFWGGLHGAGIDEILSSSASICREISSAPFAFFMSFTLHMLHTRARMTGKCVRKSSDDGGTN
jgi:hypothetical protein